MPYTPLPQHPSTMADRIEALRVSRELLVGKADESSVASTIFGKQSTNKTIPADYHGVVSLIRLAEYITVGHDYMDTHPDEEPLTEEDRTITVNVTGVVDPEEVKDLVSKTVKKHLKKEGLL